MTSIPFYATILTVLLVAGALVLGLGTLLRGTSPSRSQLYMRWRIGLQFIAIIAIMLAVYLTRR